MKIPGPIATDKAPAGFSIGLRVLLVMIVTLMALGAGVRTMNAGLSCPDWPLCYGKIIPDFHPAVWFEFVHRAYAGLVAILFSACGAYVLWRREFPRVAKRAAVVGFVFLVAQIIAGALTVLLLVKWVAVTMHLLLATLFFGAALWMTFAMTFDIDVSAKARPPRWLTVVTAALSLAVLLQIALGGIVASTYAGSVCVDWPLCNGRWVPTWQGAIGHQIIHRFMAYAIATAFALYAFAVRRAKSRQGWVTPQVSRLSLLSVGVVCAQVGIGIVNLVYFIPPSVTVLHQSVAILLFATSLRSYYVARRLRGTAVALAKGPQFSPEAGHPQGYPVARPVPLSQTPRASRNSAGFATEPDTV